MERKSRAALISVGSNTTLVAIKLVVGLASGSVSVISEAIHSGIDLLAAIIAFFAVRTASKPADEDHAYGHGKYENLSGTIEAALIFVAAAMIAHEAIMRLGSHEPAPQVEWGLAAMLFSSVVNVFVSRYLFRVAKETDSVALEADAHHLATDVYTSMGIFVGLAMVRITGLAIFDSLTALGVAGLIVWIAWGVLRNSMGALLDTSLPSSEIAEIERILSEHSPPLLEHHDLRTRKSGAHRHIDVHLTVPDEMTAREAHNVGDSIEQAIHAILPNAQVMTHIDVGEIDETTGCLRRTS